MEKQGQVKSQRGQNFLDSNIERDIVLIHGLWMTPKSWQNWAKRFSDHGYNVLTPGWPGVEGRSVDELRRNPDLLRGIGLKEIVSHYEKIIRGLGKPPIIMGHSIGGLVTQLLLDRGLGCAGVGISAGQTRGVLTLPFSTIKVAWGALKNPLNTNGIIELTYEQFKYAFTNDLPDSVSRKAYEEFYIPGPTRPLIQAGFANLKPNALTKVDYKNPNRAPLLFIAGGKDHVVPLSVNKENAFKYKTPSVTDFRVFADRTHFICGQDGWEEVADYCLNWAVRETMDFETKFLH